MIQGGVEYDLAFLRSLSWIESTGAQVGHSIHLELHEMGLDGPAQVVSIEPCPEIEPDDGTGRNVVTGTMAHPGDNILYLDITGLDEPLGVTDTHPIWSETRQDFVLAGQLEVGEHFRTLTGDSATLTNIVPHRGPPQMVFNLEVDGEHVYSVAGNGLLVHNVCPWDIGYSRSVSDATETFAHGPWKGRTVQDAIDEARKTGTLPEGLELHADFVNDQWVAANNRTLFVAQEAGLSQVHPTTGAGTLNSILKHLSETGIPLWR